MLSQIQCIYRIHLAHTCKDTEPLYLDEYLYV
jgi:hypothetical protein